MVKLFNFFCNCHHKNLFCFRILVISTCIGAAVVLWGFQAGIVSVLTVELVDYPIKSLKVKYWDAAKKSSLCLKPLM